MMVVGMRNGVSHHRNSSLLRLLAVPAQPRVTSEEAQYWRKTDNIILTVLSR